MKPHHHHVVSSVLLRLEHLFYPYSGSPVRVSPTLFRSCTSATCNQPRWEDFHREIDKHNHQGFLFLLESHLLAIYPHPTGRGPPLSMREGWDSLETSFEWPWSRSHRFSEVHDQRDQVSAGVHLKPDREPKPHLSVPDTCCRTVCRFRIRNDCGSE